jgi:hypothetical protein
MMVSVSGLHGLGRQDDRARLGFRALTAMVMKPSTELSPKFRRKKAPPPLGSKNNTIF